MREIVTFRVFSTGVEFVEEPSVAVFIVELESGVLVAVSEFVSVAFEAVSVWVGVELEPLVLVWVFVDGVVTESDPEGAEFELPVVSELDVPEVVGLEFAFELVSEMITEPESVVDRIEGLELASELALVSVLVLPGNKLVRASWSPPSIWVRFVKEPVFSVVPVVVVVGSTVPVSGELPELEEEPEIKPPSVTAACSVLCEDELSDGEDGVDELVSPLLEALTVGCELGSDEGVEVEELLLVVEWIVPITA